MTQNLDPRVLAVFTHALDNESVAAQVALVQCFSAVFGDSAWWASILADDPAVADLVRTTNRRMTH